MFCVSACLRGAIKVSVTWSASVPRAQFLNPICDSPRPVSISLFWISQLLLSVNGYNDFSMTEWIKLPCCHSKSFQLHSEVSEYKQGTGMPYSITCLWECITVLLYIMLKVFLKGTYDLPSTALYELKNVCLCIYCSDKQAPSSYSWPRHWLRTGGARWLPTASQGWIKRGEQISLLCTKYACVWQ